MSGRIWYEARAGGGAVFVISVRRYLEEEEP
jgi:hypothetical protein